MDIRDETHIIHSCYVAGWDKYQCHLPVSKEHLLIYQGRQLCDDKQPSLTVCKTIETFIGTLILHIKAKVEGLIQHNNIVYEILRIFECAGPSNFRTQSSFIHYKY